jgi:anti-sigma regulatory factor (Ser/Thr protein kinase)
MMRDDTERARVVVPSRDRILDTGPEQAFDDLALLASAICGTPIAMVMLADAGHQWCKARVGVTIGETAHAASFCAQAMQQRAPFVVPDAFEDDRFRDNPLVTGGPGFRFCAVASLATAEGDSLGALCVIDRMPRQLSPVQLEGLDALRRQVEAQLALRRSLHDLQVALAARDRAEAAQQQMVSDLQAQVDNVRRLSALLPYCSTCQFDMVIPADPKAVPPVTEGLAQMLRERRWSDEQVTSVALAVTEALTNAIRHGCGGDPSKQVECCVSCEEGGEVVVVIRDPGPGFDNAAVADPLAPENLLKAGGRGVFLINQLMDAAEFRDGGREVEMRKRRTESPILHPSSVNP